MIREHFYFIASSEPAIGLGPGGVGAKLGRGASSTIDVDFPPRVLAEPPRPAVPPPRPWDVEDVPPDLSCSALGFVRGRRVVLPPRDPGPRTGRPVSWEMGTAAASGA